MMMRCLLLICAINSRWFTLRTVIPKLKDIEKTIQREDKSVKFAYTNCIREL